MSDANADKEAAPPSSLPDFALWSAGFVAAVFGEPVAGALLGGTAAMGLARIRAARFNDFGQRVHARLAAQGVDLDEVKKRIAGDEERLELLERGAEAAARSASEDRRQRIAEIVARGMGNDELTADESRKFLSILDALSDAEVVTLIYRANGPTLGDESEIYKRNESVLRPARRNSDQDDSEWRRAALQDGYLKNLERLGLITAAPVPGRGSVNVAPLGMEFLKQIGIEDPRSIR